MTDISSQTLHIVAKELAVTLGEARASLEAYAERPGQRDLLKQCADQLHLVNGALRLAEVYGAALLGEEMELVARYLLDAGLDARRQLESLDALMRALVQLPTYLERVQSGGRDLALVLLPLLNDLRSVRGGPLLSEGTLLTLNLKSAQPALPQPVDQPPFALAQWARRLRPGFQIGLLGLIRGERVAQNLAIMAKVAEKLEQVAASQPVFQFWWVTGAVLEALRDQGLAASATLKRLLGLVDRQMKAMYETDELRYGENPPLDLLNNLLYYVARATTNGVRVSAVRGSFQLSELIPVGDSIDKERENLSAPSIKLMQTVAAAIKEDLSKVKDALDLFVRRGGGRIDELNPQLEVLRKISDTLGVLGLGELRERVQQELAELRAMVASGKPPAEDALLKAAGTLLLVEDSLDDQLMRLILPAADPAAPPVDQDVEFRLVSEAVLRECIVNLARIKEAVTIAVQSPGDLSAHGFDNVPQLLHGIAAGLLMLGKGRAVELTEAIGVHVRKLVAPGAPEADPLHLERLADAIVSIEYYMETIQSGRGDPWYMLDNAASCIEALADEGPVRLPVIEPPPRAAGATPHDHTATIALERKAAPLLPGPSQSAGLQGAGIVAKPKVVPDAASRGYEPGATSKVVLNAPSTVTPGATTKVVLDTPSMVSPGATSKGVPDAASSVTPGATPQVDRDTASTVIERVATPKVVLDTPSTVAPGATPKVDQDTAPTVIERVARPQVVPDAASLVTEPGATPKVAQETPPTVIVPIIKPQVPQDTSATVIERIARPQVVPDAASLITEPGATPKVVHDTAPTVMVPVFTPPKPEIPAPPRTDVDPQVAAIAASPPPAKAPPMDPLLHDIYSKETASHLAELREYLRKRSGRPGPHDLPESVYRAVHTLSGSSKMAEARNGIRVTEPLNHYMSKVFDSGLGLSDAGLAVLADAVTAIENVLSHIDEPAIFFAEQPRLLERIRELDAGLDAALARVAEGTAASAILPQLPAAPKADAFDLEIANIYGEEATELLEAAQVSVSAWNRDRGNKERVAEIQRQLHTLKGGARMAGIPAMGDLSHELETLVIQIDGGFVAGDDPAHAVIQASLDELARMRDLVGNGELPAPAPALIAQIRALAAGERLPAAPRIVVPSEDAAPVPAAPRIAAFAKDAEPVPAAPLVESAEEPQNDHQGQSYRETYGETEEGQSDPSTDADRAPADGQHTQSNREPSRAPADGDIQWNREANREAADIRETQSNRDAYIKPADVPETPSNSEASLETVLPGREAVPVERAEMARVDADLLDTMLNNAGEVSIFRARLDQQVNAIDFNLAELSRTVTRLKEQLRGMEIETEAQVLNRHRAEDARRTEFDPLELDRYSALQQYSRALAETSGDVGSIQSLLETLTREAQNLLTQQGRVITELQNSLMRTRMVSFQRHVQRLTRLVRQAANETGKPAELTVRGASAELDRQLLERIVPALEHMLRNAVVHGIETPERRAALGKPEVGRISVSLERDGAEVVIVVADDGAGIDVKLIREKALGVGLADMRARLTDEEAMQLILEPGFSTASGLTQTAGRGVGMDVVATEVKKLGGGLFIESTSGKGSRFTVRLPFTLAISQALIVRVADELYALPLATVEGVVRLPKSEVAKHLATEGSLFEYGGQTYRFQPLGPFVGIGAAHLPEADVPISVVLVRAGEHSTALVTDELVGSREIVVKSLGPQISAIRGIAGATILGDGRIVIILDMGSLVRAEWRLRAADVPVLDQRDRRTCALVVDDSITVRRVTQRLLERNGMRVLTAKDGVEAVALLEGTVPDIILLDIEMPRMDGYEVAGHVRKDPRLQHVPIVMITSRDSEKHRAKAMELGVNDYLGKPYQESDLLDAIEPLVNRRSALAR